MNIQNIQNIKNIIITRSKHGFTTPINVSGDSMYPTILDRGTVHIQCESIYLPGDILVFFHNNTIKVHRLLFCDNGGYYCKGDNCFDLEYILISDIFGAVESIEQENDRKSYSLPEWKTLNIILDLSIKVHCIWRQFGMNPVVTKESEAYKLLQEILMKNKLEKN